MGKELVMVADKNIIKAVSNISQRAERILDDNKIIQTYVEVGILPQIVNKNNQIIFGRRGTGKTHLFRYLESELKKEVNSIVIYIDCRTLGSANEFNNGELPIEKRCLSLFKDIIEQLHEKALYFIMNEAPKESNEAVQDLIEIEAIKNFKYQNIGSREIEEKRLENDKQGIEVGVVIGTSNVGIKGGFSQKNDGSIERTDKYSIQENEKIIFPELNNSIKNLIKHTNSNIYFLLDEWSSLPYELQPYLAEFLKRSFLPIPQIAIKIAVLEYRSNFSIPQEKNNRFGFELGSDITSNLDLDDYYVYDRNPDVITENFSEILFKHIQNELPDDYLFQKYKISNPETFIRSIFTDSIIFQELVRASEGVVRDMINIFTLAFFETQRQGRTKIDKKSVIESSRQWFERDKQSNLDDNLSQILKRIVDEVIGVRKARSFLIPRELEKHKNIQKLFDARVIHFIKRGYADKDNPGTRYNVYGLDYGTYVDLLNTTKKPELDFISINQRNEQEDFIVPFDDKRSIRRIILTENILN